MSTLSKTAILEIHDLTSEARRLAHGTAGDRKTADVLLARVANIRDCGLSTDELRSQYTDALVEKLRGTAAQSRADHEVSFRKYVMSGSPQQRNAVLEDLEIRSSAYAGSQSISYTMGTTGGMLVPNSFYENVTEGMAQTDPLLSEKNVNLIAEQNYAMRPKSLPGYDLTQIAATLLTENNDNNGPDAFPVSSSEVLNGYPFRMATYASLEFDDDDFEAAIKTVGRAHGVGLARGIGDYLVNGTGSAQPGGLLTGAANSGVTTATR